MLKPVNDQSGGEPTSIPEAADAAFPVTLPSMTPETLARFKEAGVLLVESASNDAAQWCDALAENGIRAQFDTVARLWQAIEGQESALVTGEGRVYCAVREHDEESDTYLLLTMPCADSDDKSFVKEALALRRIGRALTMNATLDSLSLMAVHAIIGALDLAGVLLFVAADGTHFRLAAASGFESDTLELFNKTVPSCGLTPLARQAWNRGRGVYTGHDIEDAEAVYPELRTGSIAGEACALPLVTGSDTQGILVMVCREADTVFGDESELHLTIAEHLAFAVRGARLFEAAEALAILDPLTGIPNHRALQEAASEAFLRSVKTGESLAFVMMDVDNFRLFNERYGHEAGDLVLKNVARTMVKTVGTSGYVGRYGGEEFGIVLSGSDERAAELLLEEVRRTIENETTEFESTYLNVTASFGYAMWNPSVSSSQMLLARADKALYAAKRNGRNQVWKFGPGLEDADAA